MPLPQPLDGPPPSPETDPTAAQEVGRPAAQVQQLVGGQNPAMPAGPDLSGVMTLGQKLVEGILALAQAAPLIAPDMDQAQEIILNALGKFASSAATGSGTSPSLPLNSTPGMPGAPGGGAAPAGGGGAAAPPRGLAVSQDGTQFPGAMHGGSRPY